MTFTTAQLISSIERRGFVPANQSTFTVVEMLAIASEEVRSHVFPAILTAREEYFVYSQDFAITSGQELYEIPPRAFGGVLREVKIIRNAQVIDIPRIEPEDVPDTNQGQPNYFYLRNDNVVLYPKPSSTTDTLRMYFYLSPGEYVEATKTAIISAIDTTTKVVTVTSIPSDWITGNIYDFIKKDGGHEYRDFDKTSVLVSGADITFSDLPSTLVVGDYVSIAGESSLVQGPASFRPSISQYATAAILDYAEQPGADKAYAKASGILETAVSNVSPRVRGEAQYILQEWF